MHNFEALVDRDVLGAMMKWAEPVQAFRVEHAACALFCTTKYIHGWIEPTFEERVLLALNSAYWWWLDDLSDQHVRDSSSQVAWEALFAATRAGLPSEEGPPEVAYLHRLSREFRSRLRSDADIAWWLAAALGTMSGFCAEDRLSRAGATTTLAEHLEVGFWSTSLVHVMATTSLLFGLGFANRNPSQPSTAERLLCLVARLENDLFSAEKERAEGNRANAVLLVESALPTGDAAAFVRAMMAGYERRLQLEIEPLGQEHPFRHLAKGMLEAHRQYYASRPGRYAST